MTDTAKRSLLVLSLVLVGVAPLLAQKPWQAQVEEVEAQWKYHLADPVAPVARLEQALRQARSEGSTPAEVGHLLDLLGEAYGQQGQQDKREATLLESLALKREKLGAESPDLVPTLHQLASLRHRQELYSDELHLYVEALNLQIGNFGPKSSEVAVALTYVGYTSAVMGNDDQAEKFFRQAVDVVEHLPHPTDQALSQSYLALADLLRRTERKGEADTLVHQARPALDRIVESEREEAKKYEGRPRVAASDVLPIERSDPRFKQFRGGELPPPL